MKGERSQQLPSSSFPAFGAFSVATEVTDALLGLGLGKKLGSALPNSRYTDQGAQWFPGRPGTDCSMGDLAPPAGGF